MSIGTSKAIVFAAAGFAAGIIAVIACDDGPSGAGAQNCDSCTLAGPVTVAAIPVCAQWETMAKPAPTTTYVPGEGSYSEPTPAPEGWEPVWIHENGYTLFLKRCTRWTSQSVP